jgi:hypothetical protein
LSPSFSAPPSSCPYSSRCLEDRCSRKLAHAGEKAEASIKIVRNAEPVIESVRGQL